MHRLTVVYYNTLMSTVLGSPRVQAAYMKQVQAGDVRKQKLLSSVRSPDRGSQKHTAVTFSVKTDPTGDTFAVI